MIEDSLLQYQLRKLDARIEEWRDELEKTTPEDLRFTQGEIHAAREMRKILEEQYQNWLRGEEEARPVSEFERMLDLAPTEP
jgi:hypothetical protein